uniref:Uncharacterized protein n=2 Tax=Arion vulgaris TaxID=1028688 RepID=A0A0B6ZXL4_9EUPU
MDSCPQALQRRAADLNNEQVPVQQISSKAAIPVINNLRPLNFSPEYHTAPDDDDDVMLPCEFCQEMFPSDLIIPHQSVCQADGVLTPRATTPPRHPSNVALRQQPSNQMSFKPSIRSPPKHHNDPNEADFLGQDDNSEIANGDLSNCRLQKFKESSSNKYSPAYNRFDEALTRPPRRSARQHSVPSVDTTEPRRESRSVQRTRASLSQLLQEDTSPEALDLVETKKEPVALGGYGGHNINRAEPKERKTKVDSRTVVRRLEESRQKPAQGSSGRRSLPQTALNTPSGDQTSQPSRTRQRADHVFSPELRLKPNSTTLPKKR